MRIRPKPPTTVHVPTDPELVALAELDKKLLVARVDLPTNGGHPVKRV